MAQLKSTIILGDLSVTGAAHLAKVYTNILNAPTTSNNATFGPGTAGQVLTSNGTQIYWGHSLNATINSGTASRIAYYSGANAISSGSIVTDGGYLGSVSYLDINHAHQTGYRLYVNGPSYLNGTLAIATADAIRFYGLGSGTYNQGEIICNSSGFTIEAPRATDANNGTALPVMIKNRGGQWGPLQSGNITANYLTVRAQGNSEGGEISLAAAPNYESGKYSAILDVLNQFFRIHSNGVERFKVDLTNGAVTGSTFSGRATTVGDGTITLVPTASNEVRFGGTSTLTDIYFGYADVGSRPAPTTYIFGKGGANATIKANKFVGYHEGDGNGHKIAYRHLDAGLPSSWSDSVLYIGYGALAPTKQISMYYSADTSSRTEFFRINSNGAYALTRFGVNGQNTSYNFYVNGSSYLKGDVFVCPTGDATLKIYDVTNTTYGNETIAIQTAFDGVDGETHGYVTAYENRVNMLLQPRGGQVYVGQELTTVGDTRASLLVHGKGYFGDTTRTTAYGTVLELRAGSVTNNTDWQLAIKNNYNAEATGWGAGIKIANGGETETGKWVGIRSYAMTTYSNETAMQLYTSGALRVTLRNASFYPEADSAMTLGAAAHHWSTGYFDQLLVSDDTGYTGDTAGKRGVSIGVTSNEGRIELVGSTPYIDFHQNYSTANYTTRIIANAANRIEIQRNGTPSNLSYNSRTIQPMLYVNGNSIYANTQIECADYFLNNRGAAGGGYYLFGNNVEYGRWYIATIGVAPTATTTDGTTTYSGAVKGVVYLTIGNNRVSANSASGVANNAQGYLRLYEDNANYCEATSYISRFYPTNGIAIPTNRSGIFFRPDNSGYYTRISYQTSGNEALVFATQNAVTSFMFINGEGQGNDATSDRWNAITPGLQIKQNCVRIGGRWASGTNADYKLRIDGDTFGRRGIFYGTSTSSTASSNFYNTGALEVREAGLVGNAQSSFNYAPRIGFHWANRIAASLSFHQDGIFYFRKQNGTDRATIDANLNGSAYEITRYSCITNDNNNTAGYFLLYTWTIGTWSNHRMEFIVTSRHTGGGLVTISVGNNTGTVNLANAYAEIWYYGPIGSGTIIQNDSWQIYVSADGTKAYLFGKYYDGNNAVITPLSATRPAKSTWMTSIDTATYGTLKADTYINFSRGVRDNGNGTRTYFQYSASGMASTSWLGSWDGYTLKAISPANAVKSGVGTSAIGGTAKPIYWTGSAFSAISATVGSATKPVYVNAGTLTVGSYELKATLNNATQWGVAYYSTTTNVTSTAQGTSGYVLTAKGAAAPAWDTCKPYLAASTAKAYVVGTTATGTSHRLVYYNASIYTQNTVLYGAAWNDYAEYRKANIKEPGRVIKETPTGEMTITTKRLERGCEIISDTYGFAIGESNTAKTPTAAAGRVLAYPDKEASTFELGMPVCSGPNGTVSQMTEEEARMYPWCIIGTVSEIPNYEIWHGGQDIKVNGRIWIRIR